MPSPDYDQEPMMMKISQYFPIISLYKWGKIRGMVERTVHGYHDGAGTTSEHYMAYHDLPAYGQPGISRTKDLVEAYYWWPIVAQDVYDL